MSIVNPGRVEVALFISWAKTVGNREYRRFVESMGLRGDEKVMDFGSGPGVMAEMMARMLGKGGKVTCVDISRKWMEVSKKRLAELSNIEFMLGDIRELPVPEESFDLIAIHYVLHDVDSQIRPGVVAALTRSLKPGGRMMIDEPARTSHRMMPEEVRRLLGEAGLKEKDVKKTRSSYIWDFRKNQ